MQHQLLPAPCQYLINTLVSSLVDTCYATAVWQYKLLDRVEGHSLDVVLVHVDVQGDGAIYAVVKTTGDITVALQKNACKTS